VPGTSTAAPLTGVSASEMPQEARDNIESPPRWPEHFRSAKRALLPQCTRE
ncbi:hypothetical protein NPIL_525241, partial [Nephila pilipes]